MERYHITITDNETGKEMQNIDTNGFIMAAHRKNDGGRSTTMVSRAYNTKSPVALAEMIWGLSDLTKQLIEESPELKPLLGLIQIMTKEE